MTQSTSYTNVFQVISDTNSLISLIIGEDLTLASVQSLAQARWQWIFNNWESLYGRFRPFAGGDQHLVAKLDDFRRFIESWRLGNRNNPLDILKNFLQVSPFLNLITLSELRLSPDEVALRDIEIDRLSNLGIEDFRAMLKLLRKRSAIAAQEIGLGDPDAAKLLGISVRQRKRSPSIDDLEEIERINRVYVIIEAMLSRELGRKKRPPNILKLTSQLVNPDSQVFFNNNFLSYTPRPFEISLEHMAQKYLGNRELWFELVTINNLQLPYIDEVGVKFPLLAAAATNNLIISSADRQNVPVGTKIGIGSHKYREEARVVERIILNENGTMILFLSGTQNINRFKPSEGAFVRIYAPSTTRSGSFILIPSEDSSEISTSTPTPSSDELRRLDAALLQFGIDIARNEKTGDLVFDPNGNFKFAAGLVNVRQTVLNALNTNEGELPFHPQFGINLGIGDRYFGTIDEALVFSQLLRDTLLADSRILGVQLGNLETSGTGMSMTILVTIAGSNQAMPLSFVV